MIERNNIKFNFYFPDELTLFHLSQTSRGKSQPIILIVIIIIFFSDELVPSLDELAVADELVED